MSSRNKTKAWAVLSLIFSFSAAFFLLLGGISSDNGWGWWPTLSCWIGCAASVIASICCLAVATEDR